MPKFCDNKLCRTHITCPPRTDQMQYVEANGRVVTVGRRTIIDENKRRFAFCEICANVLAIVNGLTETKNQNENDNPRTEHPERSPEA